MFNDELSKDFISFNGYKIYVSSKGVFFDEIKKLISATTELVVLRLTSKLIVNVSGTNITISSLQPKSCEIHGKITSIVFEGQYD